MIGGWLEAPGGYAVSLDGGRVVARSPRGTRLKSVPPALRESAQVQQLRDLREWLERHARECTATVETWMIRSLPVPAAILQQVWLDPAWQQPLRDAVVAAWTDDAQPHAVLTGFLRACDPGRGLGVVDLDGETTWSAVRQVIIPHPILLTDAEEFRNFAGELKLQQGIAQLYRDTWSKPAELSLETRHVSQFRGGEFEQLLRAQSRARSLGCIVRGGFAVSPVLEGGELVEARYWIGSDAPDAPTATGDLMWIDASGSALALGRVGPIAFSEGMRMAASIYAGRVQ